jgi:hypothetical protein
MSRAIRISLLLLLLLTVWIGAYELPALLRQLRLFGPEAQREEQARREVIRPPAEGPEAKREKVSIFWVSPEDQRELEAVETPLELGTDPVQRARVALETLITNAPSPAARVLPLDVTLLAFYLLPDGTGIADFSDALSREVPSGISSEQLAVDAIVRTLHAAVPQVQRVKILIAGQEVETLAGHVDLSTALDLSGLPPSPAAPSSQAPGGKTSPPAEKAGPAAPPAKTPPPGAPPARQAPPAQKSSPTPAPRPGARR